MQHHQAKAAFYIHEKAIKTDQSFEDVANNIGNHLTEDFNTINPSFQPSIVREAIRETSQNIEKLKKRYDVVQELKSEVSEFQDQGGIRDDYFQSGATYDILEGEKVHDLTGEGFQHNVGILRPVLQRRKQSTFDFE